MSVDPAPFNPAEALAEHLSERVRTAVSELTAAAVTLTVLNRLCWPHRSKFSRPHQKAQRQG
jgi:hypothetical protein